ncbi:hypothetical protein MGYG_05604 [Nannizzia gypsea CBS 118893]|uniref:Uncharacterized protein n=1 Tax=Arthroderma gypseum (strain ATCC MYA-4604 / CBS 118893) TaxID=535722 RepID=E4UWW8_ARTGP|nr:hypothetical protein MGYG_05604 [Nannizzia gypsea CBS 118893]EFR02607.1 hypothetical protein MGYG_05604 [Nannizzia gypsea CBS 118893]
MSGLNPFRHKKLASTSTSTAGAVVASDPASASPPASLPAAQPGSSSTKPHGQDEQQTQQDNNRRPGAAEEWLASLDTAVARQKKGETQQQEEGRALFERVEDHSSSRPASNSKTVRIASPPAKQIPSPSVNEDHDGNEKGYFGSNASEYTPTSSGSTHRASTPGTEPVEDPFNAAIGSPGSSGDDEEDEDDEDEEIERLSKREQDGLGLGLGPVADPPSLRRVSYQGDLRSRGQAHAEAGSTRKRATMDVDAFKRLLLTGDTAEGMKNSKDLFASTTATTTATRQENQTKPVGEKKLPPPPPKSRRGKAISSSHSSESTDKSTEGLVPVPVPVSPLTISHTNHPPLPYTELSPLHLPYGDRLRNRSQFRLLMHSLNGPQRLL